MPNVDEFLKIVEERKVVGSRSVSALRKLQSELENANAASNGEQASASPSDTESPRFVRGFHDVLISIGIIAALVGVTSLIGPIPALLLVIGLAEYFVRIQRLALPAVILTVATSILAFNLAISFGLEDRPVLITLITLLAVAGFYFRYRVPIAFAGLFYAAFLFLFVSVLTLIGGGEMESIVRLYPRLIGAVALLIGVVMFAIAMYFDRSDLKRETRRSDIAFWIHLGAAPILMYAGMIVANGDSAIWWTSNAGAFEAGSALALIIALMLVGIIIDRRAFVTAGLISLGAAVAVLTKDAGLTNTNLFGIAILSVGVVVLLLGAGWQKMRVLIVSALPESITQYVPPIARS